MQITWNQQQVKKENRSIVFNLIMNHAPVSRSDIAQLSGLNKGTVSSQVAELLDDKLITESGPGESSGGRRPVMLLFNQNAGYSIGIDLGVNYILGVLTDLQGNIIKERQIMNPNTSLKETIERVKNLISFLMDHTLPSPYGVVGIGIGAPGLVDNEGKVLLAPNLGWKDINLKKELESFFDIPVVVENEANAGAYGEKKFGAGRDFDNIIYVSAGIGIGVGIVIDGKLYKGVSGFSGELGHMTIDINGHDCRCGNKGCWELYASEQALIIKANEKNPQLDTSLEGILEQAKNHDHTAKKILEDIGTNLGRGIINIVHAFNPQQIIIGNRLASAQSWIGANVKQTIKDYTLPFHQEEIQIHFSALSLHSTAMGVSAFSTENFLNGKLQS